MGCDCFPRDSQGSRTKGRAGRASCRACPLATRTDGAQARAGAGASEARGQPRASWQPRVSARLAGADAAETPRARPHGSDSRASRKGRTAALGTSGRSAGVGWGGVGWAALAPCPGGDGASVRQDVSHAARRAGPRHWWRGPVATGLAPRPLQACPPLDGRGLRSKRGRPTRGGGERRTAAGEPRGV